VSEQEREQAECESDPTNLHELVFAEPIECQTRDSYDDAWRDVHGKNDTLFAGDLESKTICHPKTERFRLPCVRSSDCRGNQAWARAEGQLVLSFRAKESDCTTLS
jgi:hypothetical protein